MAVAEITIVPIGTDDPSLSKYVAKALDELESAEIEYELTPSGTILEGEIGEILEITEKMHDSVFDEKVARVVTTLRIDDRRDRPLSMEGKKKSVEEKLNEGKASG